MNRDKGGPRPGRLGDEQYFRRVNPPFSAVLGTVPVGREVQYSKDSDIRAESAPGGWDDLGRAEAAPACHVLRSPGEP